MRQVQASENDIVETLQTYAEVVQDFVAADPGGMTEQAECGFCGAEWRMEQEPEYLHTPDCLWLRAAKLREVE